MRALILATAAILAACQPGRPINNDEAVSAKRTAGGPDAPVSSDDPPLPPTPDTPTADCPVVRSSDWRGHVDAMPGPNDNPRLIVTGQVTVPTGGYSLALRMGPVAESYPVQVTVYLDATPPNGPATQALETREVRGSWRSEERVGSVTIRCGSRVLASLSGIETAH
ncbi:MAG: hypothetical protein ACR2FK_04345 [Sphingomicrobium sp.]